MINSIPSSKDRAALQRYCDAIKTQPKLIKRDSCLTWCLWGKGGHIYAIPEANTFYLYCAPGTVRAWGAAKKLLHFCEVTQDGDDEGCFRLPVSPSTVEAGKIRQVAGLRLRRSVTPSVRRNLDKGKATRWKREGDVS